MNRLLKAVPLSLLSCLIIAYPAFSQMQQISEKTRHIDATPFIGLGFSVDIGADFVVTRSRQANYGFDDLPISPLFIWEIGGGASPVKVLSNEQPGLFQPIGPPFTGFSASNNEIAAIAREVQLYQQDQGGTDNWGFN